jgi:hypothetical protein
VAQHDAPCTKPKTACQQDWVKPVTKPTRESLMAHTTELRAELVEAEVLVKVGTLYAHPS